jgi:hypothetical protein
MAVKIRGRQNAVKGFSGKLVVIWPFFKLALILVARDFRTSIFSSIKPTLAPKKWVKAVSHMASYSPKYSIRKSANSISAGSMTSQRSKIRPNEPTIFLT